MKKNDDRTYEVPIKWISVQLPKFQGENEEGQKSHSKQWKLWKHVKSGQGTSDLRSWELPNKMDPKIHTRTHYNQTVNFKAVKLLPGIPQFHVSMPGLIPGSPLHFHCLLIHNLGSYEWCSKLIPVTLMRGSGLISKLLVSAWFNLQLLWPSGERIRW